MKKFLVLLIAMIAYGYRRDSLKQVFISTTVLK